MHLLLITLFLASVFNSLIAAPAVSSVHVTFVSGNKATQYSHGSGDDGSILQYNLLEEASNGGDHTVQKRSVTRRSPRDPAEKFSWTRHKLTRQRTTTLPTESTVDTTTTTDNTLTSDSSDIKPTIASTIRARGRKRVEFVPPVAGELLKPKEAKKIGMKVSVGKEIPERAGQPEDEIKAKDTKAVKRSPQFNDNFIGSFNFPDFDEFGGNGFGAVREFGPAPNHGPARLVSHHKTAESLAPDGVFLPPIPTQASNYIENDPYLADPEVAKYAVQHVPYFHEFPHKRTVLALNERREENGLEPNILRSIRPFFAFFEINNHQSHDYGDYYGPSHHGLSPFSFHFHSEPHLYHHLYDLDDIEPSVLFYSESFNLPKVHSPHTTLQNIYTNQYG